MRQDAILGVTRARTLGVVLALISLSRKTYCSLLPRNRWGIPFSGKRLGLRAVQAHGYIEPALRRRQPVRFLALSAALLLEIEVERPVSVIMEGHTGTDRLPVEIVGVSEPGRRRMIVALNCLTWLVF